MAPPLLRQRDGLRRPRELWRAALALAAGAAALLAPLVAEACPYCAGQSVANPVSRAVLLGAFVAFPYGVVYAVVRFIRSADPSRPSLDRSIAPHRAKDDQP